MKSFAPINPWSKSRALLLAGSVGLFGALAVQAQPLLIATVAGSAGKGSADGTGSSILFNNPQGVAVDLAGHIYIADSGNNTIRIITSGVSSTLAGRAGISGSADGLGTNAFFNHPVGIALDNVTNVSNIYVTDYGNHTLRKITLAGQVMTVAGSAGVAGSVNSTGTNSLFSHPMGLAVDHSTNFYVADYGNDLIRKITVSSSIYTTTTLAGSAGIAGSNNSTGTSAQFDEPEGVAVDQAGNVYVADTGNAAIRVITSAGAVSTLAGSPGSVGSTDGTGTNALFYQPSAIAIGTTSNIYVVDYFNNNVRQVTTAGVVITEAGLAGTAGSADGANSSARFLGPQGVAVSVSGTVYIADTGNSTIRTMTASGIVTTLAGSASEGSANGSTFSARFYSPQHVAVDSSENIYVADTQNDVIRKITPAGVVSIFAGTVGVPGSTDGNGTNALFSGPQGLAVDGDGNVYVADTGNSTIRMLTPQGASSTLAGSAGNPGVNDGTGTSIQFNQPEGVAVDNYGDVYVADTWNHTIRVISGGSSYTLAGEPGVYGSFDGTNNDAHFNGPSGIAVDSSFNLYVSDYNNNTIREITPDGVVTTLAGLAGTWGTSDGTGTNALFYSPDDIAIDNNTGYLYVVDSGNNTLREMTPSGTNWAVTTVAGWPGVSGSSNGLGSAAEFYYPAGVAVDQNSYVYIADSGNNTIRSQGIPPSIVTQPQSQTNLVGTFATFTVSATGSMPFTYIWQYNSTNLAPSSVGSLTTSNAGTYTVLVSNIAGTILSSPATLTLTNSPVGAPGVFQTIQVLGNKDIYFNFTGTTGSTYSLLVSTNLSSKNWSNMVTFTMTNGSYQYTDTTAPGVPARYYLLESP